MKLRRSFIMLAALLMSVFSTASFAHSNRGIDGNWVFYITIDGAPPCQCIQIASLHEDGSVDGPANDNFSGDARGEWAGKGGNRYAMTIAQNLINSDGSAGGVYIIKLEMRQNANDSLTGEFKFDIMSNGGTSIANGTGKFTAKRIKAR